MIPFLTGRTESLSGKTFAGAATGAPNVYAGTRGRARSTAGGGGAGLGAAGAGPEGVSFCWDGALKVALAGLNGRLKGPFLKVSPRVLMMSISSCGMPGVTACDMERARLELGRGEAGQERLALSDAMLVAMTSFPDSGNTSTSMGTTPCTSDGKAVRR